MTDRDKSTLEYTEKMCEYCCNFDKEHIGMDGTSLCKLTMTLAYCEDYGGNCMFYNVPKEQIIVPPVEVGQTVWYIKGGYYRKTGLEARPIKVTEINKKWCGKILSWGFIANGTRYRFSSIGKTVFLTKEEAEAELKKRGKENA